MNPRLPPPPADRLRNEPALQAAWAAFQAAEAVYDKACEEGRDSPEREEYLNWVKAAAVLSELEYPTKTKPQPPSPSYQFAISPPPPHIAQLIKEFKEANDQYQKDLQEHGESGPTPGSYRMAKECAARLDLAQEDHYNNFDPAVIVRMLLTFRIPRSDKAALRERLFDYYRQGGEPPTLKEVHDACVRHDDIEAYLQARLGYLLYLKVVIA